MSTNELISLSYTCKKCNDTVKFTTNPVDAGAWMQNAPAMQCLKGLNTNAREMVAALKCPVCMKPAQDLFETV